MKGITTALLAIVLLTTFVAAQRVEIQPSSFTIEGFPGETIQKNITILTDGNYAVYLNVTLGDSIPVFFDSPIVVERNRTVPINFTIASDADTGNFNVKLTAWMEVAVHEVPTGSSGSGGGGGGSSRPVVKKNLTVSNVTITNVTNGGQTTGEELPSGEEEESGGDGVPAIFGYKKGSWAFRVIVTVMVILAIALTVCYWILLELAGAKRELVT